MYQIRAVYPAHDGHHFDQDYFRTGHLPLAEKQITGRVKVDRIEVEWDVKALFTQELISPCAVTIYLTAEQDLQDFLHWLQSADALPVIEDAKNYTDCAVEWSISRVDALPGY
jgi:hypothetical protein